MAVLLTWRDVGVLLLSLECRMLHSCQLLRKNRSCSGFEKRNYSLIKLQNNSDCTICNLVFKFLGLDPRTPLPLGTSLPSVLPRCSTCTAWTNAQVLHFSMLAGLMLGSTGSSSMPQSSWQRRQSVLFTPTGSTLSLHAVHVTSACVHIRASSVTITWWNTDTRILPRLVRLWQESGSANWIFMNSIAMKSVTVIFLGSLDDGLCSTSRLLMDCVTFRMSFSADCFYVPEGLMNCWLSHVLMFSFLV